MSGFDLANGKELCDKLKNKDAALNMHPTLLPYYVGELLDTVTDMLPAAIERITELEAENKSLKQWADAYVKQRIEIAALQENNQYLLEMEASYVAENEVLREQIDSWIADRDRWIARYEAAQKGSAVLQERIGKLEEALVEERANCIMAYEWKNDLPELEETCDEDVARWKEEARQQLQKEGLLP